MKGREGYTLVEVLVAILLSAVMITSVFSVALTTKMGGGKGERRMAAAQVTQSTLKALGNYMTADYSTSTASSAPGGSWIITGDSIQPPCASNWALCQGSHTVSGLVPAALAAPAFGAQVIYFVDWCCAGVCNQPTPARPVPANCQPHTTVNVSWSEP